MNNVIINHLIETSQIEIIFDNNDIIWKFHIQDDILEYIQNNKNIEMNFETIIVFKNQEFISNPWSIDIIQQYESIIDNWYKLIVEDIDCDHIEEPSDKDILNAVISNFKSNICNNDYHFNNETTYDDDKMIELFMYFSTFMDNEIVNIHMNNIQSQINQYVELYTEDYKNKSQ
jgi:hypothetical protein